ncbi:MAG: Ribosomal RNA small subunit methyltransferase A [Candidatus Jorgensenbacteria bacterium GW2011_GWA1_48_13]|uniref:Ribosomal RNA small subunit methyltransferase A n=2 Tax=Candidatus Joergenseniibacteriota TaxID=1752739 RepID=A0A0G1W937_9BACT|nr:MAG: Ribosomal RNA small subunit methyltransferase A [Candidatus Jorgensenbacteria bacterium GW2011_GWA1_48_13]KKU99398.1 MAG: Ribosomal RNA small subunit methyltransferase A [Candidatus Jorgensenbacteria bacterium GW2011_GWC1_48_8]KKW15283.1 MAG: Ribosomal RNA small subunit methyltransferase A [Candidatus Jorgensenbacteria bacterium GW2011_GWB1_50_10]
MLGQHFLKNKEKLRKIAASLEVKKNDTIVEIGPGHGELTKKLVTRQQTLNTRIIAIEKDSGLAETLRNSMEIYGDSIEIIHGDALKILPEITNKLTKLKAESYKLVGNIPYYITGKLLRTLSELETKPKIAVLTVQKEVAERVAAKPPKMNLLAASVQIWAEPEIIDYILKKDFQPPPKVNSAIIKLETRQQTLVTRSDDYYRLIKILFKQPRKTILNNLGALKSKKEILPILGKLGINPSNRPQDLSLKKIEELSEVISNQEV